MEPALAMCDRCLSCAFARGVTLVPAARFSACWAGTHTLGRVVRVLRDQAQQRIQALTEQDDDEVLGAADLQGLYRRLQHLQDRRDALQDEIVDLEEQLNRFELRVLEHPSERA